MATIGPKELSPWPTRKSRRHGDNSWGPNVIKRAYFEALKLTDNHRGRQYHRGQAWPSQAWLGLAGPGQAKPGLAKPGLPKPSKARQGLARPDLAMPSLARPSVDRPGRAWPCLGSPAPQPLNSKSDTCWHTHAKDTSPAPVPPRPCPCLQTLSLKRCN